MSSQEDMSLTVYTADEIKAFLQRTKGQKVVQVTECISDWSQFVHDIVNWGKSEVFLVGEWEGEEPRPPDGLHWKKGSFKYLGVYLGDREFMKKNWEDVLERIKGRLMKWKWLVPKMDEDGQGLHCVEDTRVLQTVEGLGLDRALFLLDTRTLDFGGLPVFYKGLFKIWELFILHRESCSSLHWLLEEPLVHSARLDISSQTSHDLSRILITAGVTKLGQLMGYAGPELTNAENFAAQLGMRSLRVAHQLLYKWSSALTSDDLSGCSITEKGCAALVSALKSNPSHLRELNLRSNKPGESGVKLLSDLLEDPHCKLETLQ
ncbi:hypothetical protein NFI96_029325 [Prochilodus magdalenae]|nr:hypothetical protein NFI96_029325 [Prochilodus magdalenae]